MAEWRSWFCMGMSCFLGFVTSHEIPLFPSQRVTYFYFYMSRVSHSSYLCTLERVMVWSAPVHIRRTPSLSYSRSRSSGDLTPVEVLLAWNRPMRRLPCLLEYPAS